MSNDDELAAKRREKESEQQRDEPCEACGAICEAHEVTLSPEDEAWIEKALDRATRPDEVRIMLMRPTSKAPQYMTAGAAGADVCADFGNIASAERYFGARWGGSFCNPEGLLTEVLLTEGTVKIPLGFAIEIPAGHVGLLKGRSGAAAAGHDAHVAAVDPDYRGEVCMLLHVGEHGINIKHGDRVGQLLIVPAPQYAFRVVDELSETTRGNGGFGSTGER